ncbi:MAG: hypothetical protein ACR2HN_01715 [Tepidiformaceae bacterium]
MSEVGLTAAGERVLREAENFCWRANVAIIAAEHLLAGALLLLQRDGQAALPPEERLKEALVAVHGSGSQALTNNVMWGSSGRQALDATATAVREAGGTAIGPPEIARGVIESGEIGPMFYSALGLGREALLAALLPAGPG